MGEPLLSQPAGSDSDGDVPKSSAPARPCTDRSQYEELAARVSELEARLSKYEAYICARHEIEARQKQA
eukprot:m51a1_g10462 hypothetical protein (69) ;mRNA; r:38956-39525